MTMAWTKILVLAGVVALSACAQTQAPAPVKQDVPVPAPKAVDTPAISVPSGPIIGPKGVPIDRSVTLTKIGFGSCLQQERPMPIFDAIMKDKPQLFLMIGDNVYGDSKDAELTKLRKAYYTLAQRAEWQRFRSAQPMLATWDDHDYGDNDEGGKFAPKGLAQKLFADFWDLPADAPARRRDGIYDSVIIGPAGKRVQIILLDTRYFRSDLTPTDQRNAPGKERYLPSTAQGQDMLGAAQWAWLEKELKKPADLRILASSIQIIAEGHGWERWGLLPAEQDRLYRLLAQTKVKGLFAISGDRHSAAIYRSEKGLKYPLYDVTSSSLNLAFPDSKFEDLPAPTRLTKAFRGENYGMLSIDWDKRAVLAEIKDNQGATVHRQTMEFRELGLK